MRVGFGSVATTEIYREGIQFRSLKIYEAGKRNETLWQIIRDNVRFPDAALGDLRAQIASCQLGARRYGELLDRYGRGDRRGLHRRGLGPGRSARHAQSSRGFRDGVYEAESLLDNDGRTLDKPLRIKVKVVVEGAEAHGRFFRDEPAGAGPDQLRALRRHRSGARRVQVPHLARARRQRRLLPRRSK